MTKFHPAFLAILSGLLLSAAWPVSPFTFLIFIAFIPLFIIERQSTSALKFFGAVYLAMLIWNTATTWWIWNSTDVGAIAAFVVNSLFMCVPLMAFYKVKRRIGEKWGYTAFVCFWLAFEYIHLNWQLTWPWLTVGNVFAIHPNWVQWYEFTGSSGGTLWVLCVNIMLFYFIKKMVRDSRFDLRRSILSWWIIVIPFLISYSILWFHKSAEVNTKYDNIVVVQPNIDPYQKFEAGSSEMQLQKLIQLSETQIDQQTRLLVWPETAISFPNGIQEDSIMRKFELRPIWNFLAKHPQLELYTGLEGYRIFTEQTKTQYSKRFSGPAGDIYFDSYNSAFLMDSSGPIIGYHKSKLVPGVESMPTFLHFLDKWFEQFGGTTGGYARQEERTVLVTHKSSYKIAPAICYESIYGEFLTAYIRNGANIIGIITNDGWWKNTPGHKQHLNYARLRAIETRRWVMRSANTGISGFIDPYGTIIDPQPWDKAVAIKLAVPVTTNEKFTLFVITGDVISKAAIAASIILLTWSIVLWTQRLFSKANNQ